MASVLMNRKCGPHTRSASERKLCREPRLYPPTLTPAPDAEMERFQRSPTPTVARRIQRAEPVSNAAARGAQTGSGEAWVVARPARLVQKFP